MLSVVCLDAVSHSAMFQLHRFLDRTVSLQPALGQARWGSITTQELLNVTVDKAEG